MRVEKTKNWHAAFFFAGIILSVGAVSCQPSSGSSATAASTDTPIVTPQPSETVVPMPSAGVSMLTLWLPPLFRSDSNSPGGNIFQRRIEAFEDLHSGLTINIRIKAAVGAGGLRDSLAAAAAAAPGSLPDLLALDQSNLRAAAIKGLIYPLEGLLPVEIWDAYFPYAKAMAVVDDIRYGAPFSGDAIVLADTLVPYNEPQRWEEIYSRTGPMFLPLGDSRSLFLFFGYYASGGAPMLAIADAEIEPEPLAQELAWLKTMWDGQVLSPRSLQIDSFETSYWAIENFGECSATLYSFAATTNEYFIAYPPTPDGKKFSLATGWAWAVATSDPVRQIMAAELMAWLSDLQFLADWSRAQGVIPPSRTALELWPSNAAKDLVAGVSEQALAFPDDEITAFAGPVLSKAARRVLLEGFLPEDSAQEAARAIRP